MTLSLLVCAVIRHQNTNFKSGIIIWGVLQHKKGWTRLQTACTLLYNVLNTTWHTSTKTCTFYRSTKSRLFQWHELLTWHSICLSVDGHEWQSFCVKLRADSFADDLRSQWKWKWGNGRNMHTDRETERSEWPAKHGPPTSVTINIVFSRNTDKSWQLLSITIYAHGCKQKWLMTRTYSPLQVGFTRVYDPH